MKVRTKGVNTISLTESERMLFSSIYIDDAYIYIGKSKITRTQVTLFNQLTDYFKHKNKLLQFLAWLKEDYNIDTPEIPEQIKRSYQDCLIVGAKPSIFKQLLRIKILPTLGKEFYGVVKDGVISYICATTESSWKSRLINFLQHSQVVEELCNTHGIQHPLEKSIAQLTEDISHALIYKQIPVVDKIEILSNDPNELALAYYDLHCGNKNNPTPAWDSFLKQFKYVEMANCFMAWVYSVFVGKNKGRQVAWVYGSGNTGKSIVGNSIANRLSRLNPDLVTALEKYDQQDKFSNSSYTRVRFTLDADSINKGLLINPLVKNLTGNDVVSIRRMGIEKTSEQIYSKILSTSNHRMWINTAKPEQLTRLLFFALDINKCRAQYDHWHKTHTHLDDSWDKCINNEIDDFIAKCEEHYYNHLMDDGHNLKPYPQMLSELSVADDFTQTNVVSWWETCIEPNPTGVLLLHEMIDDYYRYCDAMKMSSYTRTKLKKAVASYIGFLKIDTHEAQSNKRRRYIMGYDYKEKDKSKRATESIAVNDEIESIRDELRKKN